ncbi:MAG: twin-arginine translocation signal domain-containing protein, partial [Pseudomonadota bacterium]|nr:twin-arginine translocation signal domain-containing protein [Pseudomonadota bacterium]
MVTRRHFLGGSAGAVGLAMGAAGVAQSAGAAEEWPIDPPFRFTGD